MCIQLWREKQLANFAKECSLYYQKPCSLGEDVYSVVDRRTAGKLCQGMFLLLLENMQPWRGCVFNLRITSGKLCQVIPYFARKHATLERMCISQRITSGKLCQGMFLILLENMEPYKGCVSSCGEKNSWKTLPRNVPYITSKHGALDRMCIQLRREEQLSNCAKECSLYYQKTWSLREDVYSVVERRTAGKLCQGMFLILLANMEPQTGCVFSCGERNSWQTVPRNVPYMCYQKTWSLREDVYSVVERGTAGKLCQGMFLILLENMQPQRGCVFSCGERNSWQTLPRDSLYYQKPCSL